VPDNASKPAPHPKPRASTLLAAGLLLAALAVVVLYTSRKAFLSPVALVVVAAIGMAALLLQLRLRGDLRSLKASTVRGPLWLNGVGVLFAVGALFADVLHRNAAFMLVAALAAVVAFAVSGILVLSALRKHRT
jgi:uncharacterized membrane protein